VRRLNPEITILDSYFRRALMADSLVWIAGAPRSIVSLPFINEPTRTEFTYYLSQVGPVIDTGPYPTHEIVRHYRFLSELAGREIHPEPPRLPWRDVAPAVAADGPYVVLNPGSNEFGRRWPFASYLEISARFLAEGLRVVWIGGRDEDAGDPSERFGADRRVVNLMGRTRLPELLDILKHAALVISNDTGPAHLAIALGAPTVVVVGGGHFGSFVPYPAEATPATARFVYHEMPCYHCFWRCHLRANRFDVFPCISAVDADAVWREALALLPARRAERVEA
jgi:ADP-heptose:LPS heptosyltransferase